MRIRHIAAAALLALSAYGSSALARDVVGSASISFFGTPPKEVVDRVRPSARAALRSEIHLWLRTEMRIDLDTANSVKRLALDKLAERCAEGAQERHSSRGRIWTLSLAVSPQNIQSAIAAHNKHYEDIAVSYWYQHMQILENDTAGSFTSAITALSAAVMRIATPRESERLGTISFPEMRSRTQSLVDRMEVKANQVVIEGRPGSLPSKFPTAVVTIAGTPIDDFHVTVFAQNGKMLAQMVTDASGELPLKKLHVPFVHNGSMMTVSPDARKYLKTDNFIRYRDLGLRFTRGQELTFIYKVPTLTYTLEYRVSAKDNAINLPPDFVSDAHIRRFLRDSCNLQPVAAGAVADMRITLSAEFTKNTLTETEEDALVMRASVEFRGNGINLSDRTVFDRRYPFGTPPQVGEYIWEATRAIRALIRGTLDDAGKKR